MINQMTSLIPFPTLLSTRDKGREEKMGGRIPGRKMQRLLAFLIRITSITVVETEEAEGAEEAIREEVETKAMETMGIEGAIKEKVEEVDILRQVGASRRDYTMMKSKEGTKLLREGDITTKITTKISKGIPTNSIKRKGKEAISRTMEGIKAVEEGVVVVEDIRKEVAKEVMVAEETMEMGVMGVEEVTGEMVEVVETVAMEAMVVVLVEQVDKVTKEVIIHQMRKSD